MMAYEDKFIPKTELASRRRENRMLNLIDTLRAQIADGYLDNEEGFSFEDVARLLAEPAASGNVVHREEGEIATPKERQKLERHLNTIDVAVDQISGSDLRTDTRTILFIRAMLERLVEEGVLTKEEDRYRMSEEEWEKLSWPAEEETE